MFKAWCEEAMHKKRCSLGSEVGFGSLEEQEYFLQGSVFQNQGLVEEI